MKVTGRAFSLFPTLWDDVNTDLIIPGAYLREPDPLGPFAFANVYDDFAESLSDGTILVAGANFGCGSSREQAPRALISCGIKLVLAASFGFIFRRNAINLGLPAVVWPDLADPGVVSTGEEIEVDLHNGAVKSDGKAMGNADGLPPSLRRIITAGSLIRLLEQADRTR